MNPGRRPPLCGRFPRMHPGKQALPYCWQAPCCWQATTVLLAGHLRGGRTPVQGPPSRPSRSRCRAFDATHASVGARHPLIAVAAAQVPAVRRCATAHAARPVLELQKQLLANPRRRAGEQQRNRGSSAATARSRTQQTRSPQQQRGHCTEPRAADMRPVPPQDKSTAATSGRRSHGLHGALALCHLSGCEASHRPWYLQHQPL